MRHSLLVVVPMLMLFAACSGDSPVARTNEVSTIPASVDDTNVADTGDLLDESEPRQGDAQPTIPRPSKDIENWRNWNQAERRTELERMAANGDHWASETIRKLDEGELEPAELSNLEKDYDFAMVLDRFRINMRSARISGGYQNQSRCAPMPFGSSMHGPWDVGPVEIDP